MSIELRPAKLSDIIGQDKIIERLQISIGAAKKDGRPLPHLMFSGFPGLGKTTLARAVAGEMGGELLIANGGNMKSVKAILPYIARIQDGTILFIDEIHRLPMKVEEFLYPVIEEFRADVGDEEFSVDVPPFTCIGATTKVGGLSQPFINRFPLQFELQLYEVDVLTKIVKANMESYGLNIDDQAARSIARRGRGTPRIINNLVGWVRDYVSSQNVRMVTVQIVAQAMNMMEVDEHGMTPNDRAYLSALSKDVPKSLKTISDTINVDEETIERVIEPYLLRRGLISKTTKGRIKL